MAEDVHTSGKLLTRRQITLVVYVIVLILVGTVVWQNWKIDTVTLLFVPISMPRPVMYVGLVGVGFLLGVLGPWFWKRRRRGG